MNTCFIMDFHILRLNGKEIKSIRAFESIKIINYLKILYSQFVMLIKHNKLKVN